MVKEFFALALSALLTAASAQTARPVVADSPPEPPKLTAENSELICVDCKTIKFNTQTHGILLKELLNSPYNDQLRKALFWQDKTHYQFQSKAHFDNCDFDGALGFVEEIIKGVDSLAAGNMTSLDSAVSEKATRDAFFMLGQALHAIQDFYAHTNYIEIESKKVHRLIDIPVVEVWAPEGADSVRSMAKRNLVSGYVFWGFPQACKSGALSHGELAKDSGAVGTKGAKLIETIQDYSYYEGAAALAREASTAFLRFSFDRWPELNKRNGSFVAIPVLSDGRDAVDAKSTAAGVR